MLQLPGSDFPQSSLLKGHLEQGRGQPQLWAGQPDRKEQDVNLDLICLGKLDTSIYMCSVT